MRHMTPSNPYDDLAYKSCPVDWTAPERLALASLLHGGPRPSLVSYRVLELGCGNGANLLPLAYYRPHATFVGVDGARDPIDLALKRKSQLQLANIDFIHADIREASDRLSGQYDFIIAHGVFSWVPNFVRDALLKLVRERLRPGGQIYLNYNSRPGWDVRGLVREFLLAQTAGEPCLSRRAQLALDVAAKVVAALTGVEHPYSQLLANEFRFVQEGHISWIGHEFLAPDNHAYWRSEFLALARQYGLEYVADADFNYSTGRIPEDLVPRLDVQQITGRSIEDTVDLLCYRQLHSPILTLAPLERRLPDIVEFGNLHVASCLEPVPPDKDSGDSLFRHPSGYEVEAKEDCIRTGLQQLSSIWPRGLPVKVAFDDLGSVIDDLKLLQRNGLIELRCVDMGECGITSDQLNRLEKDWGGYRTTPYHTTELLSACASTVSMAASKD
jgi:SAM-dependent methyltransferase